MLLSNNIKKGKYLKTLSIWMKIEILFFIVFIFSIIFLSIKWIYLIFMIGFSSSLLSMLYILIKLKDIINNYAIKNSNIHFEKENKNRVTTIDNLG